MPGLLTLALTDFLIKLLILSIIEFTFVSEKELYKHFFFIAYFITFISYRYGVEQSFNRCARIPPKFHNMLFYCHKNKDF